MHICTYVSAVSMQPKRYLVALYHGTLTLELVERSGSFLLQLLASDQYSLVRLLGQQSGHERDKIQVLRKRDLIVPHKKQFYLKDALALLDCKVLDSMEGGDHKLFLCDVSAYLNLREGDPLTTAILRNKGIIRA
jgi:flavin reductase (DIM6/NTAB) family NADH-FMN oxidoreductase RutF